MTRRTSSKRFYLSNNGCIRRKVDAQHAVDFLTDNGLTEVEDPAQADLLLFFSCAADDGSETVAREAILDLERHRRPSARIVVGGCLPAINPDFLEGVEGVAEAFGPTAMGRLGELVDEPTVPFDAVAEPTRVSAPIFAERGLRLRREQLSGLAGDVSDAEEAVAAPTKSPAAARYERFKRSSDILRVARGCRSECAYCCIRSATGRLRSRPVHDVVRQLAGLVAAGQTRFTLTAEDVGAYGLDIGTDVAGLLGAISSPAAEVELALMAFNPRWVVPRLEALASALTKGPRVRFAVVPIQATSDRLLASMRRGYTVANAEELFDTLHRHGAGMQVHTHLIVGFPGELPSEVDDTIRFMRRHPEVDTWIYPYNDRPGTISSKRTDKLAPHEVRARYAAVARTREELLARGAT